ncbi:MAG: 4-hydroxy-tetrahydrodipicolinate reductase [Pyrinomonadaceae bacterium]
MKISLIGYGTMGKMIEKLAGEKGHSIIAVIDGPNAASSVDELAKRFGGGDVAIDFTGASAVPRNVEASMIAGVPIVEGTTGWNDHLESVKTLVRDGDGAMVYGANFSIGVNLFYRIADHAAELFAKFPDYEVFIEEQHHSRKRDTPSGTALKLKAFVEEHFSGGVSVSSTRAGNIPGTHHVGFDGLSDQILLEHTARSREGFAAGAITAGEWIIGKKGFYEFGEVMDEIIKAATADNTSRHG